jgi:hypothetical protein
MWAKYGGERDLEEKSTLERGDVGEVGRREDPRRDAEPQWGGLVRLKKHGAPRADIVLDTPLKY